MKPYHNLQNTQACSKTAFFDLLSFKNDGFMRFFENLFLILYMQQIVVCCTFARGSFNFWLYVKPCSVGMRSFLELTYFSTIQLYILLLLTLFIYYISSPSTLALFPYSPPNSPIDHPSLPIAQLPSISSLTSPKKARKGTQESTH